MRWSAEQSSKELTSEQRFEGGDLVINFFEGNRFQKYRTPKSKPLGGYMKAY